MKNILPLYLIGMLVISAFGVGAFTTTSEEMTQPTIDSNPQPLIDRAYTHTVLVEVGTATWCPSCPASNSAWHSLYDSGSYDFEYCEMIVDKNNLASSFLGARSLYWVPTSYFDGGEFVHPGTNTGNFQAYLDASGARPVQDIQAAISTNWVDHNQLEISYTITNHDGQAYPGQLRIYIIELESSTWLDYSDNPYYHAFLDFAVNEEINITAGGNISDTIVWDKSSSGYSYVLVDNVQVVLAVFDDEGHPSASDPDDGNDDGDYKNFTAYYSDEAVSSIPTYDNTAPELPHIEGEAAGKAGEDYTYTICASDPDDDLLYYVVDWGDGIEETIGPAPSGVCSTATHNWSERGDYTIRVKSQDPYGAESDWATLEISMPKAKMFTSGWLLQFLQNHPNLFPILQQLFNR